MLIFSLKMVLRCIKRKVEQYNMTDKTSILFVEDDADFRETLVDAFKLKGYNSYGVGSIEEFNESYNKSHFHLARW